jgi:acetyl esterase/lipase
MGRWLVKGLPMCLTLLLSAGAVTQQTAAKILPEAARKDVFVRGATSFPNGVRAYHGIEFENLLGYRPVEMDLYLPPKSATRKPVVLWLHGGGWSRGDARVSGTFADWPAVLAGIAGRGFVVASVDYRLSAEAHFPAQLEDVKAAIRFLRLHAADYDIDPARIYAWGGSAGGQLAALAATTCGVKEFEPALSNGRMSHAEMQRAAATQNSASDCVDGAAIWYGVFDVASYKSINTEEYLGCKGASCDARARTASALSYVQAGQPPMLILQGGADTTIDPTQAPRMSAALKAAGDPVELVIMPGVGHGWIGKTPEQTKAASLEALQRTLAFFDQLVATQKR